MLQMSQTSRTKIIAAMPSYNTELSIGDVVSRAKKYVDEVVVVDDGSHDSSARAAKDAGALVLNHMTNRGYGEAIRSCFEAAKASKADVLVILDSDGQHNPDEIPKLVAPILNEGADIVIGSRFLKSTQPIAMPAYRKFGISVITFLFNFGSRKRVSDAQSGFRAYGKKMFENILPSEKGMGVSIETLEKARREEAIFKEVPISCNYDSSALNLNAIKHGLRVAFSVVRIRIKNLVG